MDTINMFAILELAEKADPARVLAPGDEPL